MNVNLTPTKDIRILGLDKRDLDKLAWCVVTSGVGKLLWIDGYLICIEVYDKAFEYEVEKGFLPVSQICYTKLPAYQPIYEAGKGAQVPVTNVSDMKIYREILELIKKHEKETGK